MKRSKSFCKLKGGLKGVKGGVGGLVSRDFFPLFFQVGRRRQEAPFVFILPDSSFFFGKTLPSQEKAKKESFHLSLSNTHCGLPKKEKKEAEFLPGI